MPPNSLLSNLVCRIFSWILSFFFFFFFRPWMQNRRLPFTWTNKLSPLLWSNSIPRTECHRYIPVKLIDRPSSRCLDFPRLARNLARNRADFYFFLNHCFNHCTPVEIIFHPMKTWIKFTSSYLYINIYLTLSSICIVLI